MLSTREMLLWPCHYLGLYSGLSRKAKAEAVPNAINKGKVLRARPPFGICYVRANLLGPCRLLLFPLRYVEASRMAR